MSDKFYTRMREGIHKLTHDLQALHRTWGDYAGGAEFRERQRRRRVVKRWRAKRTGNIATVYKRAKQNE